MKEKLNIYKNLILKWNKVHNLTGSTSSNQLDFNIQDSIEPINFLDDFDNCVDIGSGAGFPAIPLAIYYSNKHFTLVEPRLKRVSFLSIIKAKLNLENITIINDRIENIDNISFDLVTSRAVSDTQTLFEISKHIVTPKTKYLFYKGDNVFKELNGISDYEVISSGKREYLYVKRR